MKLIKNDSYLLLVDEKAEIKEGNLVYKSKSDKKIIKIDSFGLHLHKRQSSGDGYLKIIAYYPLNSEAKELDLLLLPNPFENVDIKLVGRLKAIERFGTHEYSRMSREYFTEGFEQGYKAAQSKQFSLEDMKKAIAFGFGICRKEDRAPFNLEIIAFIQSLSTRKLPVSFEPHYIKNFIRYDESVASYKGDGFLADSEELKIIINSEGRQEIQGIYKY